MPIDTLKAARRLQEEGTFSTEQAERIAEILSDLDVASATKEDLDDLEKRLTRRINRLEKKMATEEQLKTVKSDLGKQIEETHSATIRTVVGSVAAVGAVLAVVIPLAIYLLG